MSLVLGNVKINKINLRYTLIEFISSCNYAVKVTKLSEDSRL
jgi:hypothetical protein